MRLRIEEEPVWCPLMMEHSVGEKIVSPREKKQTQKAISWTMVGRGVEPKWARDGQCRRKVGRLGAGELGLESSSVAVPSRKAEGPVVVSVRSVGGEIKSWVGWSASPT